MIFTTLYRCGKNYPRTSGERRRIIPKRISKSGIEYLDYQWGVFSGCKNIDAGICPVKSCWAKNIATRFPNNFPKGFEPDYHPEAFRSPVEIKKPSIIGVGWMGDVIGYGGSRKLTLFDTIKDCPQHTFVFLTKSVDALHFWSPFPDNCLVGASVCNKAMMHKAFHVLCNLQAKTTYLSFEPLYEPVDIDFLEAAAFYRWVDWVVIGAQSNPTIKPNMLWVQNIISAADRAGIPVFLKDNLGLPRLNDTGAFPFYKKHSSGITMELRQELPIERSSDVCQKEESNCI